MQPPAELTESSEQRDAARPAPRVVLIGASVRAAAESARRAGFSVTGLDYFGDVDTRRVCERYLSLTSGRAQSLELADQLPGAATVVVVGGLSGADGLLNLLRKRHAVFGSPRGEPASRQQLADLRQIAQQSGVRVPPTFPAGQRPRRLQARRWLFKDVHSAGGLGVRWARADDFTADAQAWHQQWIAGRAFGAVFLSIAGSAVLLGVCRSAFTRRGVRPFTYAGSSGPVACSNQLEAALVRFGNAYAAGREVTGLFNVDFVLDRQDHIWILEINRRWSASCEVIEAALVRAGQLQPPQTLFSWHWQALTGRRMRANVWQEAAGQGRSLSGATADACQVWKRIVYCRRSGRFDPEPLRETGPGEAAAGDSGTQIRFADLPPSAARVRRGEPVLTLIYQENARSPISWRTKRALIAATQRTVVPDR